MIEQQPQYPPCPECGGQRVLFECIAGGGGYEGPLRIHLGLMHNVDLRACVCLNCGVTTLRPQSSKMDDLRKAAGKIRKS
jgi:hypothetical protein